ncbi:TonB-dependent receptor [Zavarzinia sp. CC-PAN008]|uniref:TonB-dependent receptor n=1 Tax=Zavarzinia sp. CC-PAN008 TaxID=3243332 RepID=UPI003F744535
MTLSVTRQPLRLPHSLLASSAGLFALLVAHAAAAADPAAAPPAADAADAVLELDPLVVTAPEEPVGLKSGLTPGQLPQSVQVIEAEEIAASGARSIDEALRGVPSVTAAGSRIGSGASGTLRVRGLQATQMRNGIRQRYYQDVDSSALSNIERIEVLKGPSGVLYGQGGVGGLVSIITRAPPETFEGSVSLTAGTDEQRQGAFDIGGPLSETLGFRLTGEVERSGSFTDFIDVDRENVGLALAWQPAPFLSAHLVAEYQHRESLNNPGLPTVGTVISNGVARVPRSTFLGEPDYNVQDNSAPLVQAWVDIGLGDGWTLTPRFQYSEFNNVSRSTILTGPVAGQPTRIGRAGRNAGEKDRFIIGQLDLAGRANAFGLEHTLLMGVETSDERVLFRSESQVPCGVGPIDVLNPTYGCGAPTGAFGFTSDARLSGYALYAQDQVQLTRDWSVVLGVRHSETDNDNEFITAFFTAPSSARFSNTSWQAGTTYDLGGGLSLFGGYSTGYDLEWVIGARKADGTAFAPETSDQAEIGVRVTRETWSGSLSAFRLHRDNVAVPDPDPANALNGFKVQDGQHRVQGFELEGEWSPLPDWWLQLGYAYQDGTITESTDAAMIGRRIGETPEHRLTLATRASFDWLDLRAALNYVGDRRILDGSAVTLPDYVTVDIGAGAEFGALRLDAVLSNLFDEVYYYSDNAFVYAILTDDRVLPGEPRAFSLRATYRF